ncbi:MAG: T9SS type A sorting domain-containing protein, partial [Legionellales bacterium]
AYIGTFTNAVFKRSILEDPSCTEAVNTVAENPFQLHQNAPNPFSTSTTISYEINQAAQVTLKIFDPVGREVANLVNETQGPGNHNLTFDAGVLPSGVYCFSLKCNGFVEVKRMVVAK